MIFKFASKSLQILPTVRGLFGAVLLALTAHVPLSAMAQETKPQEAKVPAASVPSELFAYSPEWRVKGTGVLRFIGFKAYDATLWLPTSVGGVFGFNRPFALDIVYNTSIKASDINNTSLIEMSRISSAPFFAI